MAIRIVHLVTGLDVGGAERMLTRLVGCMDRTRFDNRVCSLLPPGALGAALETAHIPVSTLRMRRGVPSPLGLLKLTRLLREHRPQILQTWLYHADLLGLMAGRLARVPSIAWNLRASEVDMARYGTVSGWTRRLSARLSTFPDAVVVNSVAGRRAHEALGYQPRRWVLIPNGIDTGEFRPLPEERAAARRELAIPERALAFGTVSRWDPIKGIDLLIAAAAAIERPDTCFVLVGRDLDERNGALARAIDAAGVRARVRLVGQRHDVVRLLAALDCFVMPSRSEGFPNAVGEAMACGLPCVTTDAGDAAHLVGETGWVARRGDGAALAAACQRVLDEPADSRRARGLAARERIEAHFSLTHATRTYEDFYEGLAGRERPC